VLAQAMKSRAIMRKFLAVLYRSLQEDSEGIIGNTQGSSKFEFSSEEKSSLSIQLIQRLVYTAAKVDAWWLIKIIFNLPAGRIVFDSYKSRSLLPEYVAIANGHKEIAQYLQDVTKRFSMTKVTSEVQSNNINWQQIIAAIEKTQDQLDLVNDNQEKKVSGGGSDGMTSPVSSEEQQLFEKDHQLESTASKEDVAALDQKTNDLKLPLVPDEPGNNLVLSF